MSGTKIGGSKAAITNKKLHGADFYARIGRKGGKNGHTGGFAANPELAREAGRKGGKKSKRGMSRAKIAQIKKELEEDAEFLKKINW